MNAEQQIDDAEIKDGKIYAVMSYWFFLCIIPFVLRKENKFAIFHGKQGLVLFILLSAGFLFSILPLIGFIFYKLTLFLYMLCLLIGTLQALRGKYSKIPIIFQLSEKINI
jgi:uncharacterized membrane protein